MTAGMFDTRAYSKKLTVADVSERQAEVHAGVLANVLDSRFATKQDIAEVSHSIEALTASTQHGMRQLEANLRHEIAESAAVLRRELAEVRAAVLRRELAEARAAVLRRELAEARASMFRWMAGMFLAQAGLIVAAVKLL